jgi:hypothetical protein
MIKGWPVALTLFFRNIMRWSLSMAVSGMVMDADFSGGRQLERNSGPTRSGVTASATGQSKQT